MKNMKVYELTRNYSNLEELLDNGIVDSALVKEEMDKIKSSIGDKFDSIQKLIINAKAIVEKQKEEEARIKARRTTTEKNIENLKQYILTNLEKLPKEKIKTANFTFFTQKAESVVVELDLLTEDYYKITKTADRTKIKEDIKSGKEVHGARIHIKNCLNVR